MNWVKNFLVHSLHDKVDISTYCRNEDKAELSVSLRRKVSEDIEDLIRKKGRPTKTVSLVERNNFAQAWIRC